jgi:SAM-dependent methyltransferase
VYHIDDAAVAALTKYYQGVFIPGSTVLDICSSWVSHFPDVFLSEACGLGLNKAELSENKQLSNFIDKDLNVDPTLPYPDNKFDIVTCVVSVDYLTHPLEVFKEIHRVLKPGGVAVVSQSNRFFPTKAVNMWLYADDLTRLRIIGSYFHFAGGFEGLAGFDISPNPGRSDPLYIVQAFKSTA